MLKKSVAFIVAVLTIFTSLSAFSFVTAANKLGDINTDGEVDSFDCLMLKKAVCGLYKLSAGELSAADIDENGSVDMFDYIKLKRIVLGNLNAQITAAKKKAISCGKTYTTSIAPGSAYADAYNSELTDGAVSSSASYTNGAFSGYQGTLDVTINLGSDGVDICGFELSYLSINEAGILPPSSVTVYGSNNATGTGVKLATMAVPAYKSTEVASVSYNLNQTVNYSFIRFHIICASSWLFIDECLVYGIVSTASESNVLTPEKAYSADTLTDATRKNNIDSVYSGNEYDKDLGFNVISKNKSVTVNAPSGTDSRCSSVRNTALLNGIATGSAYDSGNWYGINAASASTFTVDLRATYYNLCSFSVYMFNRVNSRISLPAYVDVEVSTNGYSYTNIGRVYAPDSENENCVFSLNLSILIMARYVRFSLPAGVDNYWIEEIEVYQNAAPADSYVYGDFEMTFSNNDSYWRSNSSDYNRYQNLLFGLTPEIKSGKQLALSKYNESNSSESEASILTDGETTDNIDCYTYPWFGFNNGNSRSLFYDLEHISAISEFSVRALRNDSWGIVLPDPVKLVLSENGSDWYYAGELSLSADTETIAYTSQKLNNTYRARYAVLVFEVYDYYVFFDEIAVYGTKNIDNAISLGSAGLDKYNMPDETVYTVPSDDLLGGAEDILLVYHNVGTIDANMIFPYVAYVDKNGNVTDTMYDGFLFLISPGAGFLPSGGTPYGTNTAADWKFLYNRLFTSGRNFDALDKATGKAKKLLNIPDYKVKVYITIPHMDSTLSGSAFGDLDGDGTNEDLRNLETRISVAKTYVQMYIDGFKAKGYENIEIGGFYWFHETIARYGNDATTAKKLNAELDKMDIDLFWIPYYNAEGYQYWKEFGFDAAFYQPNYAFTASVEESRLADASTAAQNLGMSIEMEIDPSALSDIRYFRKYMNYLRGGVIYGYMDNAINMYYQNYDDIGSAAVSDNPRVRLIYDYTYQFIKDALNIKPDVASALEFSAKSDSPFTSTVDYGSGGALEYKLAVSPAHGSLSFDTNGNFVYYPNKGFTGTDTFTYKISNYLGWSDECTVTITVK